MFGFLRRMPGVMKGADVEPDTIVEIGVPADRLLGERLPGHEDVVRGTVMARHRIPSICDI